MTKIAYIIAHPPGSIEPFFIPEMLTLKKLRENLVIIPRNISEKLLHKKAESLVPHTLYVPIFSLAVAIEGLMYAIRHPITFFKIIYHVAIKARKPKIFLKNLLVTPKAIFLARILKDEPLYHIHAHWGTTTSTMAFIISRIKNIPWSFTLHRWDIYENNILRTKVDSASFVRCISDKGKVDLLNIIGNEFDHKVKVIHMGIDVPDLNEHIIKSKFNNWDQARKLFTVAVPAHLVPVKGHKYLIEAFSVLAERGFTNYKCIFFGEGYLKNDLISRISKKGLTEYIDVYGGELPNEELIKLFNDRKIDIVILPSIVTDEGEHEGIPVALIEAMAYAIPVVTTTTGSITELVSEDEGMLVKQKSAVDIANAILKLSQNKKLTEGNSLKGYLKVKSEFSVLRTTQFLLNEIKG